MGTQGFEIACLAGDCAWRSLVWPWGTTRRAFPFPAAALRQVIGSRRTHHNQDGMGSLECVVKWTITWTAPGASLITRAAEESTASTPAPPAPYRQPNRHRKYGNRDVPRTGVMKWTSVVMRRDQCKAHGMLLSGIDHDDRSGLSTHGRHGRSGGPCRAGRSQARPAPFPASPPRPSR